MWGHIKVSMGWGARELGEGQNVFINFFLQFFFRRKKKYMTRFFNKKNIYKKMSFKNRKTLKNVKEISNVRCSLKCLNCNF